MYYYYPHTTQSKHCIALHRYRAAMHPFKFKYQIPMHMHGKLGRHDIIYHIITIVPHMQYAHTMTMYMPLSTMKISLYLNFTSQLYIHKTSRFHTRDLHTKASHASHRRSQTGRSPPHHHNHPGLI